MTITVKKKTINNNNRNKQMRFIVIAEVDGKKGVHAEIKYTGDQAADEITCMNKLSVIEG